LGQTWLPHETNRYWRNEEDEGRKGNAEKRRAPRIVSLCTANDQNARTACADLSRSAELSLAELSMPGRRMVSTRKAPFLRFHQEHLFVINIFVNSFIHPLLSFVFIRGRDRIRVKRYHDPNHVRFLRGNALPVGGLWRA
jgi:hypothetical protein